MENIVIVIISLIVVPLGLLIVSVYPIVGLLLIIILNPVDNLVQGAFGLTIGRTLGVLVAMGWLMRYFFVKESKLFLLKGLNLSALLFIISMTVSSLLSPFPEESLSVSLTNSLLILMFFFIQDFIRNENHLRIFIVVTAFTVGAASLLGILQFIGMRGPGEIIGTVTEYQGGARFAGFNLNPNGYGLLMMSGIPLLLFIALNERRKVSRIIAAVMLGTSAVSLYLSMSRTHIAGLLVFTSAFAIINFKNHRINIRQLACIALAMTLFIVLFINMPSFVHDRLIQYTFSGGDTSAEERQAIIFKGLELWMENPIFGVGFEALQELDIGRYSFIRGSGAHDIISYLFTGTGLVGGLLVFFLCFRTFKQLSWARKYFGMSSSETYLANLSLTIKSAFVALLLTGLGNPLISQRIFWMYMGLSAVLYGWAIRGYSGGLRACQRRLGANQNRSRDCYELNPDLNSRVVRT